eukprot:m.174571 g.174571  ORF g.174571 m.174571 type:complete len:76 (+) comp14881_c0_seq8:2049-2276(+)
MLGRLQQYAPALQASDLSFRHGHNCDFGRGPYKLLFSFFVVPVFYPIVCPQVQHKPKDNQANAWDQVTGWRKSKY